MQLSLGRAIMGPPMSVWFRTYGFADITDRLLIGAYPLDQEDVSMLAWMHVQRILNLAQDEEYAPGQREEVQRALAEAGIAEERIGLVDFGGLPPERIESAVERVCAWLAAGERVYVHCRAGWQRSAVIAAAVLAVRDRLDPAAALEAVQRRKPAAQPLQHQFEDLERWWLTRRGEPAGAAEEE
jgi:protein-tyrosine phosphatase